jgi:two-component system, chemotaxis family, sensor kinase CheA
VDESFDLGSLMEEFRDEARDQVDRLDAGLLQLERDGALDDDTERSLLRGLHTLKGNAGMLGLSAIRDFVHVVETALKVGPQGWSAGTLEQLFEGAALLRRGVEVAGSSGEDAALRALTTLRRRLEDQEEGAPEGGLEDRFPGTPDGGSPGVGDERLRVPFAKLDELLNEVGELLGEAESLVLAVDGAPRSVAREQAEAVRRRSDRLREAALSLRLVPLSRTLGRFHGLVRRLAREQGKEARLVVEGESTEVDKSTADALAEPMLHLVRNAIDHGIEAPEVREGVGKPRHGTLRIAAEQDGDRVRIVVEDDGAGLDLAAIRSRARARGLSGADSLADDEAAALIFRAGLSTRTDVSTVSGRGVGLDVVRRSVSALRGELRVERPARGGTRFVLRLPLTVAIVPSLVFEAGGETLAVPATAVARTFALDRIERVGAVEVVPVGERLVPLSDADRLFGWPMTARGRFGVMLRHGGGTAVMTARRLVDQRDLVVKALPSYGERSPGISGASVLPGGGVILVLDAAEVIEMAGERDEEADG